MKLNAKQRSVASLLRGKTIARVEMHGFDPRTPGGSEELATDPVVRFTDGSCLRFLVQETDVGEYGVQLIYPARKTPLKKEKDGFASLRANKN